MLFSTVGQSSVFLFMLLCGLILGAWYDLTRRLRRILRAGKSLTAFFDLLFTLGALINLVFSLALANRLEIRLYALLGTACGMALYCFSVLPILDGISRFIQNCFRKICKNDDFQKVCRFLSK